MYRPTHDPLMYEVFPFELTQWLGSTQPQSNARNQGHSGADGPDAREEAQRMD